MSDTLILADAGGTKTEWLVFSHVLLSPLRIVTRGVNASVSSEEDISDVFQTLKVKMKERGIPTSFIELKFFGAGVNSEATVRRISRLFSLVFEDVPVRFEIRSDIDGAAIALFGDGPGIVAILGTGSASALFDGQNVVERIPSLGYILGDEGSGAFMGKELLNRYFKKELSSEVCQLLEDACDVRLPKVITEVYRSTSPAAYLASFVPFLKKNEKNEEISLIISYSLKLFFEKNVLKYKYQPDSSIGFVGGVADAFSYQIGKMAGEYRLNAFRFLKSPMNGLAEFYLNQF